MFLFVLFIILVVLFIFTQLLMNKLSENKARLEYFFNEKDSTKIPENYYQTTTRIQNEINFFIGIRPIFIAIILYVARILTESEEMKTISDILQIKQEKTHLDLIIFLCLILLAWILYLIVDYWIVEGRIKSYQLKNIKYIMGKIKD